MKIDLEVVKNLSENLNKYNLNEVTIENDGIKLTIKKEIPKELIVATSAPQVVTNNPIQEVTVMNETATEIEEVKEAITSPMVGTFYSSPAPGAAPFVVEGQEVKEGDTVCIVEAMKLMNEVKATKNCKIEKFLVKDGIVLKKGDKIFSIS